MFKPKSIQHQVTTTCACGAQLIGRAIMCGREFVGVRNHWRGKVHRVAAEDLAFIPQETCPSCGVRLLPALPVEEKG